MRQPCRLAMAVLAAAVLGGAGALVSGARASALFGVGRSFNQPVQTRDGTVLRADVHYPVDRATGAAAPGPFPVLLQQTPYGKEVVPYGGGIADTDVPYLVGHGYIVVIADVRGTGQSQGSWGLFNPAEGPDGADLVNWSAHLTHSNGTVGLFGVSYMAMNQFLTVGALPVSSPVKAIFPILAGNDLYRELLFQGGIPDAEFDVTTGLPVISSLSALNPVIGPSVDAVTGGAAGVRALADSNARLLPTEMQHATTLGRFVLPTAAGVLGLGGAADVAYDEAWWAARNMANYLGAVVDHHIPAFLVGGWSDLFPRGELLNYVGLQNLWAGRSQGSPMTAGQPVTPRYQLAMGPWTHLTTDAALVQKLELEWFDRWLKGRDTPLAHTTTPLHLFQLQQRQWADTAIWPPPASVATRLSFGAGGTLSSAGSSGADPLLFTLVSSPCSHQTTVWGAGASALLFPGNPCDTNDATLGMGPGALTYTSAPLTSPQVLAGPIDVSVSASSSTTDTELVATVEEVSPQGQSVPLTSGALLGSFRAVDATRSWTAANGQPILPWHPYTRASQVPVRPGQVTRYDIEVFPTFARIPAGWRLRVTLTSSDTPHLLPSAAQLPHLLGGIYQVQRGTSFINVPLAPPSAFPLTPSASFAG